MKILAFDIGGTNIKYAVCNERFELGELQSIPTQAAKGGQHIINTVIEIIASYDDIDRVAISTAGQVDSENGIVVYSSDNIPYYTGMLVKKLWKPKQEYPRLLKTMLMRRLSERQFSARQKVTAILCASPSARE